MKVSVGLRYFPLAEPLELETNLSIFGIGNGVPDGRVIKDKNPLAWILLAILTIGGCVGGFFVGMKYQQYRL